MSQRTLSVKLQPHGTKEMRVTLFFQVGDWAVTQGLCTAHQNGCFRLTHVPSTYCIPVCLHGLAFAQKIARRINDALPKFKQKPRPEILRQLSGIVKDMLTEDGQALELMPGYQPLSAKG
jgi:hypothetical protein